MTRYEY